jgi:putative drug exporter of the RND superfamily
MTTTTSEALSPPPEVPPPSAPGDSGRRRRGLAQWCAEHRWRTLFAGLLVLAGAVVLLGGGLKTSSQAGQLVGDSAEATRISAGADFGTRPTETVVVTQPSGALPGAQTAAISAELRRAYARVPGVATVGAPTPSPDGRTLIVAVGLDAISTEAAAGGAQGRTPDQVVGPTLEVTRRLAAEHPDLRIGQVGPGSIDSEVGRQLEADFRRAELVSLPVTLGVLLVAFGAVVAAGVPVLLGVGAVVTALGVTAFTSRTVMPVDQNTQSLVLLIGLAVGVDYALFVLRRAREERAAGASVRESIARAGATAGRAVVISGVTVVVAMSGMLVAGGLFTSLAIGAMLVVAVAVLASATVVPALLAVLADKVEALRLPFPRLTGARHVSRDGLWGRVAGVVVRRPLAWTLAAGVLLAGLALPALGMRTSLPGTESLPRSFAAVDAVRGQVVPRIKDRLQAGTAASTDAPIAVHVGGAATGSDLTGWLHERLPWVMAFVLVLTFVVMLLSFGSAWLAVVTVGLNLLSVGAAYGVLTAVFQHTWAEGVLGFTSIGSIVAWLPLLMFVLLFGLSMDYHVFVVSRVREAWTAGAAPREAVRTGVARSAGVVTSAAAVMVAVFSIFGTLSTLEMKQLGVGLATAVLLDATLVRGVLLPAVLALLGRRAHTGPRWLPVLHH